MPKKISILLVDDEPDLIEIVADVFGDYDEVGEIVVASSAQEGLDFVESKVFDVIISDERMPGLSGQDFLKKLTEKFGNETPAFYIVTGDLDVTEEDIINLGGTGLIAKPYDVEAVAENIINKLTSNKS